MLQLADCRWHQTVIDFLQRKNVAWQMPIFRQTSSTDVSASSCCKANAICLSVNRDFFIGQRSSQG